MYRISDEPTNNAMLNLNTLSPDLFVHKHMRQVAGNNFEISVVAGDEQWAEAQIDNAFTEIGRVFRLLSADSQLDRVNHNAGVVAVKVSQEVFNLVDRQLKIAQLTNGAFDITISDTDAPASYRDIEMNAKESSIFLIKKGIRIHLRTIIKGYATDRARYILQMQGVSAGVINAFGDLITWGSQPDGKPWTLEAADPEQKLKAFSNLNISNMAVSTTGNNNAYPYIDAEVHAVDPKTSLPLHPIKSVSVLSPSAELAAAMSAPVKVMGVKMSLRLFNKLNQLVCVIVNNRKKVYTSKSIDLITF